jgi:hypothetical protein
LVLLDLLRLPLGLTDRVAGRPAGSRARDVYGADGVHEFARCAILEALALEPGDHLLDVGCGGGLLLRDALATGATRPASITARNGRTRAAAGARRPGGAGNGRAASVPRPRIQRGRDVDRLLLLG